MDCQPLDDLCMLQQDFAEIISQYRNEDAIETKAFILGVFNDREYTYGEIDGSPVIVITPVKSDMIGKFELNDAVSGDVLNGDEHGERR